LGIDKFKTEYTQFSQVKFETVDFCSEKSLTRLISNLSSRNYDVLINCASTLATKVNGNLRNESVDFDYLEFSRVMQYNVSAIAAICFGLKNQINLGGSIINVTSSAAQEGAFATVSYNASKAAVDNLTKSLANTLGLQRGIRVNSIAPG
jgi:3-oxoacyl-[acyl-carrier protein] reductase